MPTFTFEQRLAEVLAVYGGKLHHRTAGYATVVHRDGGVWEISLREGDTEYTYR